jgi:hypothetical protein
LQAEQAEELKGFLPIPSLESLFFRQISHLSALKTDGNFYGIVIAL